MSYSTAPSHIQVQITEWIEEDSLWAVAQALEVSRDVLKRIKKGQRIHTTTLEAIERRLKESKPDATTVPRSTEPARTGHVRPRIVDVDTLRASRARSALNRTPLTSTLADALARKPPK